MKKKKKLSKDIYKKFLKNVFIGRFKNVTFVMIYTIYKMLVLLKNHLNYSKDSIFE